jgi:hypothetical protein
MANSIYATQMRKHAGIPTKYCRAMCFILLFIKLFFFDGEKSDSQWIVVNLDSPAVLNKIEIKFQGGFSSSLCVLEAGLQSINDFKKIFEFYPNDDNSNQVFTFTFLNQSICVRPSGHSQLDCERLKILQIFSLFFKVFSVEQTDSFLNYRLRFEKNTDLFGRVIIYNLQFYGNFNNTKN